MKSRTKSQPNTFIVCLILLFLQLLPAPHLKADPNHAFCSIQDKARYNVEIHEARELVLILLALGDDSAKSLSAINRETDYYNEVIQYFSAYREEEIVKTLHRKAKDEYFQLTMDAACFSFNEMDYLEKSTDYSTMSWGKKNHMDTWIKDIQAFADKSNYRQFLVNHQEYYTQQKALFESQVKIDQQWTWLEKHCKITYDHYHIFISPLTHDMHSTRNFSSENYKEAIMFVSGPLPPGNPEDEDQTSVRAARMLFTEIDHNYVNPVSRGYTKEIRKALRRQGLWADRKIQLGYRSDMEVFNEYMTWALFSLYAQDTYDPSTASTIQENIENWMSHSRGFVQFKAFNQYLMSISGEKRTIEVMIPEMISWCNQQL